MFCRKCGKALSEEAKFCTECGQSKTEPVKNDGTGISQPSHVTFARTIDPIKSNYKPPSLSAKVSVLVFVIAWIASHISVPVINVPRVSGSMYNPRISYQGLSFADVLANTRDFPFDLIVLIAFISICLSIAFFCTKRSAAVKTVLILLLFIHLIMFYFDFIFLEGLGRSKDYFLHRMRDSSVTITNSLGIFTNIASVISTIVLTIGIIVSDISANKEPVYKKYETDQSKRTTCKSCDRWYLKELGNCPHCGYRTSQKTEV